MIRLIHDNRPAIEALCTKHFVARLELFGSAADGTFHEKSSDLDFLVEFRAGHPKGPFHQFFDFQADLKALLGRKVDLIERSAMKNPYFIKAVNKTRTLLYAA